MSEGVFPVPYRVLAELVRAYLRVYDRRSGEYQFYFVPPAKNEDDFRIGFIMNFFYPVIYEEFNRVSEVQRVLTIYESQVFYKAARTTPRERFNFYEHLSPRHPLALLSSRYRTIIPFQDPRSVCACMYEYTNALIGVMLRVFYENSPIFNPIKEHHG